MSDKMPMSKALRSYMPNDIRLCVQDHGGINEFSFVDDIHVGLDYIAIDHPDYHVIKKSDVDGDVIKKMESIRENIISLFSSGIGINMTEFCVPLEIDEIINALIAQSKPPVVEEKQLTGKEKNILRNSLAGSVKVVYKADPDTVTIPRKVLEWWAELCDLNPKDLKPRIEDKLNYKEDE